MSKFSSYKQSQLLFENWRKHVNEGEEQLGLPLGKEEEQEESPSYSTGDLARIILKGAGLLNEAGPHEIGDMTYLLSELDGVLLERIGSYLMSLVKQQEGPADLEVDPETPEPETPTPEPGEPKLRRSRLGEQQELDEQDELPTEVSKVFNQLKAMKTRDLDAFNMALGALQSMGEGV